MIVSIGNHLWQSSLVVAAAGLLTLALRNNRAHVRYWLWLAASVKFLIPFSALMVIGGQFGWRATVPVVQPALTMAMGTVTQPFSRPDLGVVVPVAVGSPSAVTALPILLVLIWLGGALASVLAWWGGWRRVSCAVRAASVVTSGRALDTLRRLEATAGITRPIAMVASGTSLEPGVFGILNPVLLWPHGMDARLTDAQVAAILMHELSHVRRHDNLTAAVQMLVQTVFWFHPIVWWVGARLVDERERACDDEVIRFGSDPELYAESILTTCEFYVEAPRVCVAGVTGSELRKRIARIMSGQVDDAVNGWRKVLLASAGVAMLAVPLIIGALNAPRLRAQSPVVHSSGPAFEAASVKANNSGVALLQGIMFHPGGRFTATNASLRDLIGAAYGEAITLPAFQISGGPKWIDADRFDIVAKAEGNPAPGPEGPPPLMFAMLRALLAERFKLITHNETRELPIYALVTARGDGRLGPQIHQSTVDCAAVLRAAFPSDGTRPPAPSGPGCGMRGRPGHLTANGVSMAALVGWSLSGAVNRLVVDRTGLPGLFDWTLEWTPEVRPPSNGGNAPEGPGAGDRPATDGPSIFTALREPLGLKLEPTKGPVDVLIIDSAEHPTAN